MDRGLWHCTEVGDQNIPKKKEIQKGKMVLWGLLTNSWEEKWQAKEKKESYIHLNTEFQRIARRDKKAFLIDQCKEMEGNNRMVKSRDLFKKIEIPREHFMQRWHNICQQIWKTRQWPPRTGKDQFPFQFQRKAITMFKLPLRCTHLTC